MSHGHTSAGAGRPGNAFSGAAVSPGARTALSITSSPEGPGTMVVKDTELPYLRRCVELAAEALAAGDEPFGSVLVGGDGTVLGEDHNRVASGDRTRHPEFELARWSATRLTPGERAAATVYTSGEHCPMCAAAHAWVGLGRIVYVASSEQLASWLSELEVPAPPVRTLPVHEVAPGVVVDGPVPELTERVRELHVRFHRGRD
jgi:tRNA(Arg) A34 adenosine deaminase TadA